MEAGVDTRTVGFSRSIRSIIAGLIGSFGVSLALTALMRLWEALNTWFFPPPQYDRESISYIAFGLVMFVPLTLYGLTFGQGVHQLGHRFKTRTLSFYLFINLLCAGIVGLVLNLGASGTLMNARDETLADYGFFCLISSVIGALWGLIFFAVRRPDRDASKDVSPSAS